jgi:hypothetical protein
MHNSHTEFVPFVFSVAHDLLELVKSIAIHLAWPCQPDTIAFTISNCAIVAEKYKIRISVKYTHMHDHTENS